MSAIATASVRYPARLTLRAPIGLPQAIEAAARSQMTSPSEYVRRALLRALNADGVHLDADGRIDCNPLRQRIDE
jgi:hypothetical protein